MKQQLSAFQKTVKGFYAQNARPMPWRSTTYPYAIFLSEVMLQQTQVDRVIPKFEEFIKAFPTVQALAEASFKEVLAHWSGLGYNRRALWLHQAAQEIATQHGGAIPPDPTLLIQLKGIGPNTAASICVYAFNLPLAFIETNIRTVFIHHFFADRDDVADSEILPIVEQTLDTDNPREWYWALMDHGTHLKKLHKNPSRKSKHHTTQSTFEGSRRQIRGKILRYLLEEPSASLLTLSDSLESNPETTESILVEMEKDGLLVREGQSYALGGKL